MFHQLKEVSMYAIVPASEPGVASFSLQKMSCLDSRLSGHPKQRQALLEGVKNRDRDRDDIPHAAVRRGWGG